MRQDTPPLTLHEAKKQMATLAQKAQSKGQSASVYIKAPHLQMEEGFGSDSQGGKRSFHTASVSKLFTTALIARQTESGRLRWDTPVYELLPPGYLDKLFVYEGVDHQKLVTIAHLLGHTSGIADFYEDTRKGPKLVDLISMEKDRAWTLHELIDITRNEQQAIGRPGERFHYSDTGFGLLILVIEKCWGKPYHEVIHQEIFVPLRMTESFIPGYSRPERLPVEWEVEGRSAALASTERMARYCALLRHISVNGHDLSQCPSLSMGFADGGVACSSKDLVAFMTARDNGKILRPETLARLHRFDQRFSLGIAYGLGAMQLRFQSLIPLVGGQFFKGWPPMVGHMGSTACLCFSEANSGLVMVINLGDGRRMGESIRLLIQCLGIVRRVRAVGC